MTHAAGLTISARGQLRLIGDALWDPEDAVRRIRDGAAAWLPAVLFAGVVAATSWLSVGPMVEVLARDRASGLSPEQIAQATSFLERFRILLALGTPLVLWIKWGIISTLIWLTCTVAGRDADHRTLLRLVIYASGVQVLQAVLAFGVIVLKAPHATSVRELQLLASLAALWPDTHGVVAAVLASIGIFDVWFFAVLVVGVRRIVGFQLPAALLTIVPAWTCLTAGQLALLLVQH